MLAALVHDYHNKLAILISECGCQQLAAGSRSYYSLCTRFNKF